ncbi:MAG: molybdenum cofactor guanylyltransferase MobA [Gammaproteobacteria bacterium]|jgi:molybdopterin-guanine dinucleotide biosynthesis protein A
MTDPKTTQSTHDSIRQGNRLYTANQITGVILAGGKARRMNGQDKGLVELNGQAMVNYIAHSLQHQVASLCINANRNQNTYANITGLPVISDTIGDFAGPLAGMASAMAYNTLPYLVAVPCDSPLLDNNLVGRLYDAIATSNADIALAKCDDKLQPVFVLLKTALRPSLEAFLKSGGRKIIDWYYQHAVVEVDFSDAPLMFENVNAPDDLQRLSDHLASDESLARSEP